MIEVILLAQLAQLSGPRCGWLSPGVEITPENTGSLGCTVPGPIDGSNPYGIRLRADPFTPGGIRAEPAGPAPIPNQIRFGVTQ